MGENFIILSEPVIVEDGKLVVVNSQGAVELPGGFVFEGETLEEACVRNARAKLQKDIEIIKPLSPRIMWKQCEGKRVPIVSINYKARLKRGAVREHGR